MGEHDLWAKGREQDGPRAKVREERARAKVATEDFMVGVEVDKDNSPCCLELYRPSLHTTLFLSIIYINPTLRPTRSPLRVPNQ